MNDEETYVLIDNIRWGKRYDTAENGFGETIYFIIKPLTVKERNYAKFLHKTTLDKCVKRKMLTKEDIMVEFKKRNIWDDGKDRKMAEIEVKLDGLNKNKKMFEFQKSKLKIIERQEKQYIDEFNELQEIKDQLFIGCAEYMADQIKLYYELQSCILDMEEKPFWQDGLGNEKDTILINNIMLAMRKTTLLKEENYRALVRSNYWTLYWSVGKDLGAFGNDLNDYTIDQLQMCYWANYYDSIRQIPEGPSDDIVNDDKKLDEWLDIYMNKQKYGKEFTSTVKNRKPGISRTEVFIKSDSEGANDVYKMNSPSDRMRIQNEQMRIMHKGEITEYQLRQQQLRAEASKG